MVVSDDLLVRLNVRTGDLLHIGGQDFRIAGVMVSEPDRMTGSLNVGPRVMISRAGPGPHGADHARQPRGGTLPVRAPGARAGRTWRRCAPS